MNILVRCRRVVVWMAFAFDGLFVSSFSLCRPFTRRRTHNLYTRTKTNQMSQDFLFFLLPMGLASSLFSLLFLRLWSPLGSFSPRHIHGAEITLEKVKSRKIVSRQHFVHDANRENGHLFSLSPFLVSFFLSLWRCRFTWIHWFLLSAQPMNFSLRFYLFFFRFECLFFDIFKT